MPGLTAPRVKTRRLGSDELLDFPVKANAVIYQGAMVALQAGYLVPASAATGLLVLGRAEDSYDNTGGIDGALIGVVLNNFIFNWDNNTSTDALTQADVGLDCYAVDDHTVGKSSSGRSKAGKVVKIEGNQVWVAQGLEYL